MGVIANINNRRNGDNYPPTREIAEHWEWIEYWEGLLEGNEQYVRNTAIQRGMGGEIGTAYVAQPLPYAIAQASSNLLFGEPVQFKSGEESDQANIERIIKENRLNTQLRAAGVTSSSLGEVYAKVTNDPSTERGRKAPVIQFIEPGRVIPEFNDAGELTSAKIVTEWDDGRAVYRLFECHTPGFVHYELYVGSITYKGSQVGLETNEKTRGRNLPSQPTATGIDELKIVHIANALKTSSPFGVSDFAHGIDNLFYAFNDATSIAHKATQAGVPYTVVPRELLDENQNLKYGKSVIAVNALAGTLGDEDVTKMITTIQHDANQDKFMAYANEILDLLLTFSGINPQSFGRSVDGGASSGIALKLKMSATLATAAGKASFYEDGLARLLQIAAKLDAMPVSDGVNTKPANEWKDVNAPISVKISDGLPDDEVETASIIQTLKAAGAISLKESVKRANPNFTDEQVMEEIQAIQDESLAETKAIGASLPTLPTLDTGGIVSDLNAGL